MLKQITKNSFLFSTPELYFPITKTMEQLTNLRNLYLISFSGWGLLKPCPIIKPLNDRSFKPMLTVKTHCDFRPFLMAVCHERISYVSLVRHFENLAHKYLTEINVQWINWFFFFAWRSGYEKKQWKINFHSHRFTKDVYALLYYYLANLFSM